MSLRDNKLIAWATAAGSLLAAVSLIGGGIVYQVRLRDDATASRACDADHEKRMRDIETVISDVRVDVRETKTDVAWIRRFLDRQPAAAKDRPQTAAN